MAKILIAEDDPHLAVNIQNCLKLDHHSVEVVTEGQAALASLRAYSYDLVILDWNLPARDGIDICREFRQAGGKTPILMLTGRSTLDDKEAGLDSGADDYLCKPCHPRELLAHVRALLRRSVHLTDTVLELGLIKLDPLGWSVNKEGKPVVLRPMEFKLLEFFMRHPGQVFSAEAIFSRVWGADSESTAEVIKTHIKLLRKKLDSEGKPSIIRTVQGIGYLFEPDSN